MAACATVYGPTNDATQLAVFDRVSRCISPICTDEIITAAFPIQVAPNRIELRDGSVERPIQLPKLKRVAAPTITNPLFVLPDGTLAAWDLSSQVGRQRLMVEDGELKFEDDTLPEYININMCEAECEEIEETLGVRQVQVGGEDFYQIVRVKRCCCGSNDFPEPTEYDDIIGTLNAF